MATHLLVIVVLVLVLNSNVISSLKISSLSSLSSSNSNRYINSNSNSDRYINSNSNSNSDRYINSINSNNHNGNRNSITSLLYSSSSSSLSSSSSSSTTLDNSNNSNNDNNNSNNNNNNKWLPSFATAALGGLLFGGDIGGSSSVVRILGEGTTELGKLDTIQLGTIASVSLLGAMIASFILIIVGDKQIGRQLELRTASVLFTIGTLVQSLSPSLALVLVGRLIYGLGIGTAMHVAPLYIAETAPNNLRGTLVSLKEAAIVGGIVVGYLAGAIFGEEGSWRGVFESFLPIEIMMLIGAFSVPESPRWLSLRSRNEEAMSAMVDGLGLSREEATNQINAMTKATMTAAGRGAGDSDSDSVVDNLKEILSSKYNRRALLIGVGLVLFQQLSGQPSVLYFANRIFENAGLGFEAAVGVGVFKLLMTLVSAKLVENPEWGRKQLLLYGNAGITASLLGLSAIYTVGASSPDGPNQAAIISCILLFVGGYQIGFGPITWLILSEIFPLRIRSAAVSTGTLANFGSNLLVAFLFETEREQLGEGLLFLQFAFIAAAATAFTSKYVFETRGLSLEQIEEKLKVEVDK